MRQPCTSERTSRRGVLAGLAAVGTTSAVVGVGSARIGTRTPSSRAGTSDGVPSTVDDEASSADAQTALEPTGTLDLRGVAEAVVDDDGTIVYCSLGDGFGVLDCSDPAAPVVLYEERNLTHDGDGPMQNVMDVKVSGNRLLVPGPNTYADYLSGFFLYDVSDPANPERVAFHETDFGPHNSFIDGEYVYLTGSSEPGEPVVVYDVTEDDPEEVARWSAADADDAWAGVSGNYRQAHDVYVQDGTLYVAYWDAGTWLVDVSDPENPTAIDQLGGHEPAYLKQIHRFSTEFYELPGNSHYVQPNADASAVFVGKEAWDREGSERDGGPGGIECWDLSGDEPELRTVLEPPEAPPDEDRGWTAHNFGTDGDRLYSSWYGGGVRVYDVSDLAEPRLLGEWREPETTWFWTANPLDSGCVATSYLNRQNSLEEQRRGEDARLYVFPEPGDESAVSAPTMRRRRFPEPGDEPGVSRGTETAVTTPPRTTKPTPRTTPEAATSTAQLETATDDRQTKTEDDADTGVDGALSVLGGIAGLAAGGLGLRRLRDRVRDDE